MEGAKSSDGTRAVRSDDDISLGHSHQHQALFNIGDLTPSLYESDLAAGLLPNKITDLSSLLNSGEARSPKLNRATEAERITTFERQDGADKNCGKPDSEEAIRLTS